MPEYAVIETGGKQYKVAEGDVIEVEKLDVEEGAEVQFDRVLLIAGGKRVKVGSPTVEGARVVAQCLRQKRGPKVRGFKYKPKKHYKRTWGHRQYLTELRVTRIES